MTTSDLLTSINIVATVAAVIAAPIIALWVGMKLQSRTNARQQKLQLLGALLSLRHVPLSPDNFKALNLLDAVFVDDSNVREAWSKYYAALNDANLNNPTGTSIRDEKRRDLLIAIIASLGLSKKISTSDLLRTYAPTAIVEAEMLTIWERIKRREDLRSEFIARGIGFPDFTPAYYPPQASSPTSTVPQPGAAPAAPVAQSQRGRSNGPG